MLDHLPNRDRVRLITDLEDVVLGDETEAGVGGLEVVDRLAHVALGGEDECRETFVVALDLRESAPVSLLLKKAVGPTSSASQISFKRLSTSASRNFEYRKIAQRDWIGSMILLDMLQARAKRVVLE